MLPLLRLRPPLRLRRRCFIFRLYSAYLQTHTHRASFKVACSACSGTGLIPPTSRPRRCPNCDASGLVPSDRPPPPPPFVPPRPVCIIGAGISGLALSCSLSHRGVPHAVFDRDPSPAHRRQGYSLTLQQSRAASELGLDLYPRSLSSTRHVVLDAGGVAVASWGVGLHGAGDPSSKARGGRRNFHIPRSALRSSLLSSNNGAPVHWGKDFKDFRQSADDEITVEFADGSSFAASLLVGCDGVRSAVRRKLYAPRDDPYPLTPSGVTVALGIFPPSSLPPSDLLAGLLDFRTVAQVADGRRSRFYLQPYDPRLYMWQFSYLDDPWGGGKGEARRSPDRIRGDVGALIRGWPIGPSLRSVLDATPPELISAYSIADRPLPPDFRPPNGGHDLVTLLGDAAHPMTPFKGWGGNAALADGLGLGRVVAGCAERGEGAAGGGALAEFEGDMLRKVRGKVEKSREAVAKLHGEIVLKRVNVTRGSL